MSIYHNKIFKGNLFENYPMKRKLKYLKGERVKLKDTSNLANIVSIGPKKIFSRRKYSVWEYEIVKAYDGILDYNPIGVRKVNQKNIEKIT